MRNNNITGGVLAVLAVVVVVLAYLSLFTVPQTRQALVVRLGDPVRTITEPGLHAKWPFIDSVIYVDNRILDLENASQEVICSDQKRLVVDAFARYRIVNPLLFYQTVSGLTITREGIDDEPLLVGADHFLGRILEIECDCRRR